MKNKNNIFAISIIINCLILILNARISTNTQQIIIPDYSNEISKVRKKVEKAEKNGEKIEELNAKFKKLGNFLVTKNIHVNDPGAGTRVVLNGGGALFKRRTNADYIRINDDGLSIVRTDKSVEWIAKY